MSNAIVAEPKKGSNAEKLVKLLKAYRHGLMTKTEYITQRTEVLRSIKIKPRRAR